LIHVRHSYGKTKVVTFFETQCT